MSALLNHSKYTDKIKYKNDLYTRKIRKDQGCSIEPFKIYRQNIMGVLLSHSLERSGETDQGCSIELFKIYRQNIMGVLLNHSLER